MPSASNRVLTDREEIRRWAEERDAKPSCVKGTGSGEDTGMIRLDFPGYSGENSLQPISWDDWFDKFEESGLALIVQDTTARGQRSNFNKLVSRETTEESQRGHRRNSRSGSSRSARSASSGRSRSAGSTRSRNQNRSEGRSSRRKTTARAGETAGRSSARSAKTRNSSSRSERASSQGRAGETGTRTSRGSTARGKKGGLRSLSRSGSRSGARKRTNVQSSGGNSSKSRNNRGGSTRKAA